MDILPDQGAPGLVRGGKGKIANKRIKLNFINNLAWLVYTHSDEEEAQYCFSLRHMNFIEHSGNELHDERT